MAATKHREVHDVEQTEKMIPLITCEIASGQHVCEFVFGVNMLDLDIGVHTGPIKQPIRRNSVGSGHASHRGTSFFDDHLDHCFVAFKIVQLGFELRRTCVCGNVIHI